LEISAHHTIHNVVKIIVPEEAPHVISHSRSEAEKWMKTKLFQVMFVKRLPWWPRKDFF